MNVYILITNHQDTVNPGSAMVFDTIRTGFPMATVHCVGNGIEKHLLEPFSKLAKSISASFINNPETIHHDWIATLLNTQTQPFFVCDTDVVFWRTFEQFNFSHTHMAGRRIPQWRDEFTKCITRPRLHTSLLYIDPIKVNQAVQKYRNKFPKTPFNPFTNLIDPLCVPFKGEAHFYDTMAMMYHAIGGTPFTDLQLDCYDHMNFGTIEDVVLPHLSDGDRGRVFRDEVYKEPIRAKGMWRHQEQYYEQRAA